MNPVESLLTGVAPDHAPGLVAALLVIGWMAVTRWPLAAPDLVRRWAAALLAITAAVHLALPLAHQHGSAIVAVGFAASAAGYGWLAWLARAGRRWRLSAALLAVATLAGYLVVVAGNGEEPDQVGLATALVELAILGLAVVPAAQADCGGAAQADRRRPVARIAAATTILATTFVVGGVAWAAAFAAHDAAHDAEGTGGHGDHEHGTHGGRSQAGVLVRPGLATHHATEQQRRAAADLAARTSAAVARYARLDAAYAAGFKPGLRGQGTDVHLEHPGNKSDGRVLDPEHPEMLVYAIEGGRASLLGVVYVMDQAGRPGPEPGGPVTRWHAHNLCLSVLPPGIGVVTPFGNCPAFSVTAGTAEMMHVWVVDNPGGPFAESLDAAWVREHNDRDGLPYFHR